METAETVEELKLNLAQAQEEVGRGQAGNENMQRNLEVDPHFVAAGLPKDILAPYFGNAGAADRLIGELQRRLWDVLQRNSFLEQESHAGHSALIQNYEGYINCLEEELRRCQELLRQHTGGAPVPKGQS
ncbi:hypothetical protein TraAM80_00321 [Trypanosoma rangeli]|uniref:Uncharacterized protein n=1 Tax=Trypanosoma rangeli TaxID=5698 RepID=A0A3R7P461_TRYRA|nr:uncharacterized protein TraAM80_00321 [Trypanosoma rangeli]RNF12468.1 hypothetical protein TraAM80_00321 [Trypanosoma rangeli]|eukprot:RNF12468.1 hypothetical protein TraAM80_00321 [Trypanosoma rangeli]